MTIRSSATPEALIASAAQDFFRLVTDLLSRQDRVRVLLTGGTLGISFVAAIGKLNLPWERIWLMFSDERFVALDHQDRNEQQALGVWPGIQDHLVRFPDPSISLSRAKELTEAILLVELGDRANSEQVFDLTVLGMGPDAHIASLFPGRDSQNEWVVAEPDSPKPPSERLSLSYKALNRSERVWFLAAGESKRWAVSQSLDANSGLPAALVRGTLETVWYLDSEITDGL